MKSKLFILLALLPLTALAQITKVTEEQKQQALRHVTEFCNLLTQWGNGQRTLDTKIYALCSGNDCSAYDDVSTNKETTLRNYLLGIQKKYPKRLSIRLSQPSTTNCEITYEPNLSISSQVNSLNGDMDPYTFADIATLQTMSYKNAYLAFKISHTIPGHSTNAIRLIIYDLNTRKITAYVAGQGTFVSYLEGLNMMTKGDYRNAIQKFETAMANQRSSLYKSCNLLAAMCSAYLSDYQSAKRYLKASGDAVASKYGDIMDYIARNNWVDCIKAINECEQLISKSKGTGDGYLPALYLIGGLIYSLPDDIGHNYNIEKSVDNLRKAIKLGNVQSAYMLFDLWLRDDNYDNYLSEEEPLKYLEWAAEKGHLGAILRMGKMAEVENPNNKENSVKWFTKGANLGDPFCMACLGRILISIGNKEKGCEWLRKSLEGDKFEKQLKAYSDLINEKWWPKSRSEIQSLLENSNTSILATPTPSTVSSTLHSNSSATTTGNSTTSYHYNKHRGSFNKAKDNYVVGLSVGYVQKQWTFKYEDGDSEKSGFWEDTKQIGGIQAGIRINPQFGYGFGMDTGLYYEYYQSKSNPMNYTDGYGKYTGTLREHALYLPLRIEYRLNFSKYFQLFFYGGIGLDYGLANSIKWVDYDDDSYNETINNIYDSDDCPDWKRFNYSLEYGGGIRTSCLQLNFTMAKGLKDMSSTNDYKVYQGKNLMLALSIMF